MTSAPLAIAFDRLLARPGEAIGGPGRLRLDGGRIAAVEASGAPSAPAGTGGRLLLPALANAHDHGRGMRTLAFGASDDALEIWLARLGLEPVADPYLRALVAFGRLALSGVAVLNHCHNPQVPGGLVMEAEAVARATRDLGVRVAFAVPVSGANPVAYGDPAPLLDGLSGPAAARLRAWAARVRPWADQLAEAEEIFGLEGGLFSVQYGPVAPQWVADEALREIAGRSEEHGRRIHMHLLETRAQREWADARHPGGLLRHLDALGLLSPRLTVAHGVHLTPAECELLAERGVHLSVNVSSNLRLRSGIAPIARYVAAGLRFGMGLDGMSFDDDEDALREMRLLWHLQRGFGVTNTLTREALLRAVLLHGRDAILGPGAGQGIAAGADADLLVLDTARIEADALPGRADLLDLLFSRARCEDVAELWVAGEQVVAGGRATRVDLAEAEAEFRDRVRHAAAAMPGPDHATLDEIAGALHRYHAGGCHATTGEA